ncbi:MAG: SDR family oxidoreductase [Proteobacteria bacterium]|nr:SDR family oxidoreductase [Pseudomonadota bacterium]
MSAFTQLKSDLKASPRTWLVTGAAGFIGSNLVEALLKLDQRVVGIDNFATGHRKNLNQLKDLVTATQWERFRFMDADLRIGHLCQEACSGVDYVLHQGALGSVPRSVADPVTSNEANVLGFLNIMLAARDAQVKRLVYASSSSVYGDHPDLPKVEDKVGNVLSPYAATKKFNEIYADVFARTYGFKAIGLRYFNVFGPRQDPDGAYAAVIPKWVASLLKKEPVFINGDGETSRDFCFVENVVQANLLAATTQNEEATNQAYNIAVGDRTTLNDLYRAIHDGLRKRNPALPEQKPTYREFRVGDVRHSLANVDKARRLLGYEPTHTMPQGLELALDWYVANVG